MCSFPIQYCNIYKVKKHSRNAICQFFDYLNKTILNIDTRENLYTKTKKTDDYIPLNEVITTQPNGFIHTSTQTEGQWRFFNDQREIVNDVFLENNIKNTNKHPEWTILDIGFIPVKS